MASIEEVWGSAFPSKAPMNRSGAEPKRDAQKEGRVYNSPQEKAQASQLTFRKTIDDLSRTLPIVQSDEEAGKNFRPQKSNIREGFRSEYAYAPPGFQNDAQELKLNRILSMIEQNKSGYEPSSTHDMLLYVFTGIVFLFTLDSFVSLGRRMR
jgi:hypothetical protein